jgi:hypothetical protein
LITWFESFDSKQAKSQFVDKHLERIDQLDLIHQMWALDRKENDTSKQVLVLEKIEELQTHFRFRCNSE